MKMRLIRSMAGIEAGMITPEAERRLYGGAAGEVSRGVRPGP